MTLIDRYIMGRFLANFFLLLGLLFVFAIAIDMLLQLDRFVDAAEELPESNAGFAAKMIRVILNFYGPRVFQFYAYMLGLVTVGAMGFTLAQMHRHRELVAVVAAGVRLHRVAVPILVAAFALNLVHLANQEFILPRMAPLLIRDHGDIGQPGAEAFPIHFTPDSRGTLLQAPSFDPTHGILTFPTFLERDEAGRTVRRITANRARWDADASAWRLDSGRATTPRGSAEQTTAVLVGEALEYYVTDLGPEVLKMRRYGEYATMLSLGQIREMLRGPGVLDGDTLMRFAMARFSTLLINMMVLIMALPYFLLRSPASMLRNSLLCAATAVPAMLGALLGFAVAFPGIPGAISVFLPAIVLLPVTLFMVSLIKT